MTNKVALYGQILEASHGLAELMAKLPTSPAQAKGQNALTEATNYALKAAALVDETPPPTQRTGEQTL